MAITRRNRNLNSVLKHFAFMWGFTVVGLFIATLLPRAIIMPLSIICIVLLIIACFVRSVKLANSIMYAIPFLMGILLFWITQFFIGELGKELVLLVFGASVAIFIILALIGMMMSADISNWGSYLFTVIIVFSLIFMFVPVNNMVALILAAVTVLLFSIYTVYDFNQIRHNYVADEQVIRMALNLYLNFINLFTNSLEVIWRLKNEFN